MGLGIITANSPRAEANIGNARKVLKQGEKLASSLHEWQCGLDRITRLHIDMEYWKENLDQDIERDLSDISYDLKQLILFMQRVKEKLPKLHSGRQEAVAVVKIGRGICEIFRKLGMTIAHSREGVFNKVFAICLLEGEFAVNEDQANEMAYNHTPRAIGSKRRGHAINNTWWK